jgi:hypothetical protein
MLVAAAMALAVTMSGCGVVDDNSYSTRDGVGAKLQWSSLSEETRLIDDYVSLICQQADLVRVYRDGTIPECRPSGAEWAIFVQAGMNDIDRRCDGFLNYIDYLRRSRVHWLNQLTQTLAATSTVMGATGASAKSMEIVTAAFGLAANSLTNSTERLLTLAEHSTVQSVVLGEQRKFRIDVRALGAQINNRPAAIHTLRNYLRICMPMTIEQQINSTVTIYQQGGMVALDRKDATPLIDVRDTVGSAPLRSRDVMTEPRLAKLTPNPGYGLILDPYDAASQGDTYVSQLLNSLCVPISEFETLKKSHRVGPVTQAQIAIFKETNQSAGNVSGTLTRAEATGARQLGPCGTGFGKNAFEKKTYFQVTPAQAEAAMTELIGFLKKISPNASLDPKTTKLDGVRNLITVARTNAKIAPKLKKLPPAFADQMTPDLYEALFDF